MKNTNKKAHRRAIRGVSILAVGTGIVVALMLTWTSSGGLAAPTELLNSTFGTSNSSDVPDWDEAYPPSDLAEAYGVSSAGEDQTIDATSSNKFAKIKKDGWICHEINADNVTDVRLFYYFKGDTHAESTDYGRVEYSSDDCNDGPGSSDDFTVLTSHALNSATWSSEQEIDLPASADDNSEFAIRFRNSANSSDEHFRVDGVRVTGDLARPDMTVTKTNNTDGSIATDTEFTWTIRVQNNGDANAVYDEHEVVLEDDLPATGLSNYTDLSVTFSGISPGDQDDIDCDLDGTGSQRDIECKIKNDRTFTFPPGSYIDVSVTTSANTAGTYTNPKSGGDCRVKSTGFTESDETNNNCNSSSVTVVVPGAAVISGYKWEDLNGNGEREEEEPGIEGWKMALGTKGQPVKVCPLPSPTPTDEPEFIEEQIVQEQEPCPTEVPIEIVALTLTGVEGQYSFDVNNLELSEGNYVILEESRSGWEQTFPSGNSAIDSFFDIFTELDTTLPPFADSFFDVFVDIGDGSSINPEGPFNFGNKQVEQLVEEEEGNGGRTAVGQINIIKVVNGGPLGIGSFKLYLNGELVTPGTYVRQAGTFVVSEDPVENYTGSFSGDCDSTGTLVVGGDTTVTCTLTNTYTGQEGEVLGATTEVGDPANLDANGLKEGDLISASNEDDPDVYGVNAKGYKRLFLNPIIFTFYHGWDEIKQVTRAVRDLFPTSMYVRNCEAGDSLLYAVESTGEDTGFLHLLNLTEEQAVAQDPEFLNKLFCINNSEFNWYTKSDTAYNRLSEVPVYSR